MSRDGLGSQPPPDSPLWFTVFLAYVAGMLAAAIGIWVADSWVEPRAGVLAASALAHTPAGFVVAVAVPVRRMAHSVGFVAVISLPIIPAVVCAHLGQAPLGACVATGLRLWVAAIVGGGLGAFDLPPFMIPHRISYSQPVQPRSEG